MLKTCKICSFNGDPTLFKGKKCKSCVNQEQKEYNLKNKKSIRLKSKARYLKNKKAIAAQQKLYVSNNKEKISSRYKKYVENNKEKISLYHKNYYRENGVMVDLEKKRRYQKNWARSKRSEDPFFKLKQTVSSTVLKALKSQKKTKRGESIVKYLSYSFEELKDHLEKQFHSWMNWNNWGVYNPKTWDNNDSTTWTWQIDHIVPQSTLPYSSMADENFKKCWALENLRPYSAKQNIIDGKWRFVNAI